MPHATDTKLDRDVAIKILPEAFAQDGERMARFQRDDRPKGHCRGRKTETVAPPRPDRVHSWIEAL